MPTLPRYHWGEVPDALRTRRQLAEAGLRPGGPVVGYLVWGGGRHARAAALYAVAEAVPKRQATAAQLAALERAQIARRTCRACGTVFSSVRTRFDDCPVCWERERAADRQAACRQAAAILHRPELRILDTETTSLDGFAVEIAVLDGAGQLLLTSLLQPGVPIAAGAQAVHGLRDADVATAPTFGELLPQLTDLLAGRPVAVYNAAFDEAVLWREMARLTTPAQATAWCAAITWLDVMELYATFCGDWSERHGDYRWQPLPGAGHRAAGDCQACLDVLRRMAQAAAEEEAPTTMLP